MFIELFCWSKVYGITGNDCSRWVMKKEEEFDGQLSFSGKPNANASDFYYKETMTSFYLSHLATMPMLCITFNNNFFHLSCARPILRNFKYIIILYPFCICLIVISMHKYSCFWDHHLITMRFIIFFFLTLRFELKIR